MPRCLITHTPPPSVQDRLAAVERAFMHEATKDDYDQAEWLDDEYGESYYEIRLSSEISDQFT